jgi:uncharacterized SAM-binding protein YcdF (DUF218 family)
MRAGRARLILLLAAAVLLPGAALVVFAWNAARLLNNPDAPAQADAIVILAGTYQRALQAGELYRRGLAPQVYVSVPAPDGSAAPLAALGVRLVPKEEIYEQTLAAMGVPAERIRRLGRGSLSTFDEAREAVRAFPTAGTRLLLVTSPFHVRRTRMIFEDALAGRGVQFLVVAATQERFPDRWWGSQDAARDVLLEWSKIVFYVLGGRFRAAEAA